MWRRPRTSDCWWMSLAFFTDLHCFSILVLKLRGIIGVMLVGATEEKRIHTFLLDEIKFVLFTGTPALVERKLKELPWK